MEYDQYVVLKDTKNWNQADRMMLDTCRMPYHFNKTLYILQEIWECVCW